MQKPRIQFTKHAINRFRERFGHLIQDNDIFKSMAGLVYSAKEDKRMLNNTRMMVKLQEAHGYDKPFKFLVTDECVFVCRDDALVTVYGVKDSVHHFSRKSSRFKKVS